jgi:hypothetical protein
MEKHQGLILVRSRCEAEEGASGTVFMLFFPDHGVGKSVPAAESTEQSAAPETSEQLA